MILTYIQVAHLFGNRFGVLRRPVRQRRARAEQLVLRPAGQLTKTSTCVDKYAAQVQRNKRRAGRVLNRHRDRRVRHRDAIDEDVWLNAARRVARRRL